MEIPQVPEVIPPSPRSSQRSSHRSSQRSSQPSLLEVPQPSPRSSPRSSQPSLLEVPDLLSSQSSKSSSKSSSRSSFLSSLRSLPVGSHRIPRKEWIETESSVIKSISDEIKEIKKNTCYTEKKELKNVKTCKISDEKIENISYFLSHKLPKCKELKIDLKLISDGHIISRGAFGYSFLVENKENKKIIIKIIICDTDISNSFEDIKPEILLHKMISRLDQTDNFVKLYGYFTLEKTTFLHRNKYVYKNINDERICELETRRLGNDCETYLFIEAGNYDLKKYKQELSNDLNELNEFTHLFYNFINFYKISEKFLLEKHIVVDQSDKDQYVFIHSDIKPDNLVVVDNGDSKKIKLIDFGVSYPTNTFYQSTETGTKRMYMLLFGSNSKLYRGSILFDIFSAIISYVEVMVYKISAYNIEEEKKRGDSSDKKPADIEKIPMDKNIEMFEIICADFIRMSENVLLGDAKIKSRKLINIAEKIFNLFNSKIIVNYKTTVLPKEDITEQQKNEVYDILIDVCNFNIEDKSDEEIKILKKQLKTLKQQYDHIDNVIQTMLRL